MAKQTWTTEQYMEYLDKNKRRGVNDYEDHATALKKRGIVGVKGIPLSGETLRITHIRWNNKKKAAAQAKAELLGPGPRLDEIEKILDLNILSDDQKVIMIKQVIKEFRKQDK